ncbi:MAG: UDP-N-acetylglucosamine 2-epimerase (non-hydrolyzing) [Acidimicrobiales bacterium]|jgi:UDP-N-acetylglucosamine 2-epimerase (non-hydrolysing)
MHMVLVAGARPNFMKVAPVLWAAEKRGIEVTLVHSGQHYDHNMSDVFFEDLGIRAPDVNLGVGSGTQAEQTAGVMVEFEKVVAQGGVDILTVVGDVNSTVACGLVAAKFGIHVAHVEAGLRSRDWGMPEEINRVVTDRLSDFLFVPSPDGVDNLRAEGYREDQIHLVGNVMVDTLLANLDRARDRDTLDVVGVIAGEYGLVTLHRPSNVDDPEVFGPIADALNAVAADLPLVFPMHPRTKPMLERFALSDQIRLIEPAGYLDFIALQAGAKLVLTDSGGIQEETTMLGVPCLTLRENTERPITVTEGSNRVVGTKPEVIVAAAAEALAFDGTYARPDLWDGSAAERIIDVLLSEPLADRPRPTDLVS